MNYYIQGNKEKADQIRAAFEAKGCVMHTGIQCDLSDMIYYSLNGKVGSIKLRNLDLFKSHPNYKELELLVEPKFKVGDWLYHNKKGVYPILITDYDENLGYQTECLSAKTYLRQEFVEKEYHLWSIQDAKDGDVLAINWHEDNDSWEKIIIFKNYHAKGVKGLTKEPCVEGYGNTFKNGKLAVNEEVPYYSKTWTHNLQPATKEQRDLLFQKMKENGCEWDAEKKELRKIKPHYDISNFNPFDKVLVRQDDSCTWGVSFFGRYAGMFMCCSNVCFTQCIPFEGNEHLFRTTDMCDEMYINW